MTRIGILGAAGFIGNRAVEYFHMAPGYTPRAIVRRPSALALSSRMNVERCVADATDVNALQQAFRECDVVVSAVAGDPEFIVSSASTAFTAAAAAGVRKFVYLSSASVHGQAPAPGTSEESPLPARHDLPYNRAKCVAEERLLSLAARSDTALAILRPGIVYGPRSQWIGSFADALLEGSAYLVNGGAGICNAIYVDNLLHAVECSIRSGEGDGLPLLVGDSETVSWLDLLAPVAGSLGFDAASLPAPAASHILNAKVSLRARIMPAAKRGLHLLPPRAVKALQVARKAAFPPAATGGKQPLPAYSRETALLHSCTAKLPSSKATRLIGYAPPVSFAEGMARSLAWLRFADYPVVQ